MSNTVKQSIESTISSIDKELRDISLKVRMYNACGTILTHAHPLLI